MATRKPTSKDDIYCESNQTLSLIIPILVGTFPNAKFIWLIRNGLDQVSSAFAKQWYSGHSENHDRYEDCPPVERMWIDGRIRGDLAGSVSKEEWNQMSRFEKCCWYWNYVNRLIYKDLTLHAKDSYRQLKLEEINHELGSLLDWMGFKVTIVPSAKKINIGKRPPYHWSEWSHEDRESFKKWCGDLMDIYYPEWRSPDGTWNGIPYDQANRFRKYANDLPRLVKLINSLRA
jgi:hypothetical protein